MQTRAINPQSWLGGFHVNMGNEVSGAQRTLYVSGMTSNAADGSPQHDGDLVAQFKLAWKNLCEVLEASNMKPENIVRLNFYTTDVDGFMAKAEQLVPICQRHRIRAVYQVHHRMLISSAWSAFNLVNGLPPDAVRWRQLLYSRR